MTFQGDSSNINSFLSRVLQQVASGNGILTAVKEAEGVYCIGCVVDQYDDGANGDWYGK